MESEIKAQLKAADLPSDGKTSLYDAIAGAKRSDVLVYPVGVGDSTATRAPLARMAHETGGAYHGASTSSTLKGVYSSIAAELRRTWRIQYVTAGRPGETLHLRVALDPEGAVSTNVTIPGSLAPASSGSGLPSPFYSPLGGLVVVLIVAFLTLTAAAFLLAGTKGSWLKSRLAPHIDGRPRRDRRRTKGARLAAFAGLFRATEQAFGHRNVWQKVQRRLERADVPLRTVEFFYLKAGHSFKQGIQTIVDEGQEPASKELGRVITDTRLGRPMDEALSETAERIGSKNFSFVITAVTIQRQVGGSLAGLFDMIADTVRQRQQFARKIRSLTAMGRASAYVLVGLPFFVGMAMTVMNPTYMDPLYHSSTGHTLIMIGLVMMAIGSLMLKKIVSFRG